MSDARWMPAAARERLEALEDIERGDTPTPWREDDGMVWDDRGDAIVRRRSDGWLYFEPEVSDFLAHAPDDLRRALDVCDAVRDAVHADNAYRNCRCSDLACEHAYAAGKAMEILRAALRGETDA